MDANRQRFFLLADRPAWRLLDGVRYDRARRMLSLASERAPQFVDAEALARQRLLLTPGAFDRFGTRAYWDPVQGEVWASGAVSGAQPIYTPPPSQGVTDLAPGYDDVLYIAVSGRIDLKHPAGRFELTPASLPGFTAWRLAAHPSGGVYALDQVQAKLARLRGLPLPTRPYGPYRPDVFRPRPENPHPPELVVLPDATLPPDESAVGIATSPAGRLAVLTWSSGDARVRILDERGRLAEATVLEGARHPYSLAWVSEEEIAVLLAGIEEAAVYAIDPEEDVVPPGPRVQPPSGSFHPLRDHDGGPFLHGVTLPPRYPTPGGPRGLYPLSLATRAPAGVALGAAPFDAATTQAVWHRIYLEASIPAGCGIRVRLAATNERVQPDPAADTRWFDHCFGAQTGLPRRPGEPAAAWLPQRSEIPFQPGMLPCAPERDRAGLFTALVQRAGLRVRSLRGRYLWVQVELFGNGRATPEIAALRVYASRFSYVDHYLPAIYRESAFAPEADEPSAISTPADFLERFLGNFEGILTPLEDRIASSYLLSDPRMAPEDALPWLGSWIGYDFDGAFPADRRRNLLERAPDLYRWRGTLRGLQLALDTVMDGAVQRGSIVVLEDFKLRRTFATILGADLSNQADPLLPGLGVSGNSYVGDTLFLGDETRREFLALFSADLEASAATDAAQALDARAIAAFFDALAYRVTILVHEEFEEPDLGLVRRVVEREKPAHVVARVVAASYRFLTGMSSLVGIDTYLVRKPAPRPVELGRSRLGAGDFVEQPPSLDPRLASEGEPPAAPTAALATDAVIAFGQPIHLDATGSTPGAHHAIARYIWKRIT